MRIIGVDEDKKALGKLEAVLKKLAPDAECFFFDSSLSALAKARETEIDVAFLESGMDELDGLDLGRYLQELNPYINLIYLTGETDVAYEAMKLHASGFIKKPGSDSEIKTEFDHLRYPELRKKYKRAFAQTFGNFEFFVDGVPVEFKYKRTKEIIAILINNRGSQTTNGEIIACLWEDDGEPDKKASYLSNLRQDLQNTLNKLGMSGIILKQRGSMAIATGKIECDLYDWLDKRKDSKYNYMGEYMNQYSWAEEVHAQLDDLIYDDWES